MKKLYAIRDDVANFFSNPIVFASDELFRRDLINLISVDDKHPYSLNSGDYVVYCLGTYHEDTASFDLLPLPERLYSIAELKSL